ncbi:hypothetical protein [Acidicapsa acidisoli]|uniref:hypothetical protein n=1 Tax=Acidicapsa acidisoli TaxID=1615681 RepID=UPI0021E04606|nr:hypothetical protein [Acidicapsa acidisoli]
MTSSFSPGLRFRLLIPRGIALALALAAVGVSRAQAQAQDPFASMLASASASADAKKKQAHAADQNVVPPSFAIPVAPLGFAPPAAFYLGDRFAQVSLNFLDEDTLLFTFRVPGLIAREPAGPGQPLQDKRHIRAVTLSLPDGKVTAEALWELHDYSRYLWPLKSGKFILRDRNALQIGDAALHLQPFLRFPGPVSFIEFAPDQALIVADTNEPAAADPKSETPKAETPKAETKDEADATQQSPPSTTSASMAANDRFDAEFQKAQSTSQSLVRILRMDNRKVMLFSRVNGAIHLPVDGEGYYEALRGSGSNWMVSYQYFQGSTVSLGWVESTCNPTLDALSPGVVLASACNATGARHLTALLRNSDKDHARLWDASCTATRIWPLLETSSDGTRLARATLEVTHPIGPYNPLDDSDIRDQIVQVFDVANGKVELTVPASPVLDGGGNFALSPSGQRFAVLNDGAIQVYNLPPAPPIPPPHASQPILAKP